MAIASTDLGAGDRWRSFRHDLQAFAKEFFPDYCRLPFSPLHHHLFERRRLKIASQGMVNRTPWDVTTL